MRVLHLYSGNLYGGVERVLVTLARHRDLCPAMEPHFALCFDGQLSLELEATGAPVHRLGRVRISQPVTVMRARRALADLLRRESFDVVICHSAWSQAIFGTVVPKPKPTQVFWLHDTITGRHWLERWARRTPPDLAICNSNFTADKLPGMYPGIKTEVVYYPVAPPEIHYTEADRAALRAELSTPENATVIVQVSRMELYKGHGLHLAALAEIADVPNWICWVVGGAQRQYEVRYAEELKQLAARYNIADRVRFLGQRSDIPKLLAAADIFCQPNVSPEAFGIVFIEAMYARMPVVSTAMGGVCEIVGADCSVLVPPDNTAILAKSLRRLIEQPNTRAELGEVGRARLSAM